ncbi:hypothetical protein B6U81_01530 [Thermoplasmatales archaeon ex4484_30]|nr:MAG: hypothetical protein B6U81_01530 [Thermoplasmatales archaeon ex4484_30]
MELEKGERILLRKKANLAGKGYKKSIGTLFITNLRLSFIPILPKKNIDIHFSLIKKVELVGKVFKKMKVVTEESDYIIFLKEAENVIRLLNSLID